MDEEQQENSFNNEGEDEKSEELESHQSSLNRDDPHPLPSVDPEYIDGVFLNLLMIILFLSIHIYRYLQIRFCEILCF